MPRIANICTVKVFLTPHVGCVLGILRRAVTLK